MSSPVTDGEQWSDELDEHDTSPQGLGYAPLDYQVLDGEEEDENENEAEETETAVDVQDAASSQQPDVRGREGMGKEGGEVEFSCVFQRNREQICR